MSGTPLSWSIGRMRTKTIWKILILAALRAGTNSAYSNGGELSVRPLKLRAQAVVQPIAWWHFDEGSGTAAADVIGTYPGTTFNEPQWVTGVSGNGLRF